MSATNDVNRLRPSPDFRFLPVRDRLIERAGYVAATIAGAITMLILFTAIALATVPEPGHSGAAAPEAGVPDNTATALMRTPIGMRECVTDFGWSACLYRMPPRLSGIAPARHSAAISDPHSRAAIIGLLVTVLLGGLALVGLFWRHLAMSFAAPERPTTSRRQTRRY